MARSKSDYDAPEDQPIDPTPYDPAEPAYVAPGAPPGEQLVPPPPVLSPQEQARLAELKARAEARPLDPVPLTEAEKAELDSLNTRASQDKPLGLTPEDSAKVQALRVRSAMGAMPDDAKAELDRLSMAESEAAGHAAPVEVADAAIDGPLALHGEVLALFGHMVEVIPALRSMEPMLRRLRARYDGMVNPPVDAEAPPADKG